jgi:hypothetical protein
MSNITALRAGGTLSPIMPQTIEEVYRLATMALKSGMLKPLKTGYGQNAVEEPAEATLARGTMIIMQGMEIGVPPMQSIQLLAMINGRITAHSEAVPGILWAKGFKLREWFTGAEMSDEWTAHCEITRPTGEKIEGSFSVAKAKRAGLWDRNPTKEAYGKTKPNDSAWFRYPDRMLKARALGFAGKDGGADALKGIQVREEAEDMEREMRDVTPPTPAIPELAPPIPSIPAIPDINQMPRLSAEAYPAQLEEALAVAKGQPDLIAEIADEHEAHVAELDQDAQRRAEALFQAAE